MQPSRTSRVSTPTHFMWAAIHFYTAAATRSLPWQHEGVPAAYPQREWVEAGGLTSYGTSFPNIYRLIGTYSALILKGEKPSDLPVVQPSKCEFVINMRTATALGWQFREQFWRTLTR